MLFTWLKFLLRFDNVVSENEDLDENDKCNVSYTEIFSLYCNINFTYNACELIPYILLFAVSLMEKQN